jgi:uracil-DNA glycosylase family 4
VVRRRPLVTKRYRSLASLQRDNRRCRACLVAGYRIESRPIFEGTADRRAYLYGQAPGIVEAEEGRPWRGRAGKTLRAWLDLDEDEFYETFYCAAVTRCYPGKPASGRGDRTPTPQERALCATWREHELRLLEPRLVVTVGGLAAKALLGASSLECVGRQFELDGVPAIPLPHPSGASGWLNSPANRELLAHAVELVRAELGRVQAES